MVLHPGDAIDFLAAARDPDDCELEYSICVLPGSGERVWQPEPEFHVVMTAGQISAGVYGYARVRSHRDYHAKGDYDDVTFAYTVLPSRSA